jgi:signal transduction histidine kinase
MLQDGVMLWRQLEFRRTLDRAASREGTRRFAAAMGVVALYALLGGLRIGEVPLQVPPGDGPLAGLVHPSLLAFVEGVFVVLGFVEVVLVVAAAWLARAWFPAAGWVLLLVALQWLQDDLRSLTWGIHGGVEYQVHNAVFATVLALWATDPARRLGRWVVPVAAGLVGWYWAGLAAIAWLWSDGRTSLLDPLPDWYGIAASADSGWVLVGLAALVMGRSVRPALAWLRDVLEPREADPALLARHRRWFRAALLLAWGLLGVFALTLVWLRNAVATPEGILVGDGGFDAPAPRLMSLVVVVLIAMLLRHRLRLVAWFLLWFVGLQAVTMVMSLGLINWLPRAGQPEDAMAHIIAAALAVAAWVLLGTLLAAEPGRRLGRWILPLGAVLAAWGGLGSAVGWSWWMSAVPVAGELREPWWVHVAVLPIREWYGAIVLGFPLLGLAGELRAPFGRTRARVRAGQLAPGLWPGIVLDELLPGRLAARRAGAEAERFRLAADVHAEILPSLNLVLAESEGGASGAAITARLRALEQDVRSLVAERRLVVLEEFGIVEALEWLAERAEDRGSVTVDLLVHPSVAEGRPPIDTERAAFRVAQLAVDNALLHAAAGEIRMEVLAEPHRLSLRVQDDGRGLAPGSRERATRENRQGLLDMRLHADLVRARLDVAAEPAGGTVIRFDWPAP